MHGFLEHHAATLASPVSNSAQHSRRSMNFQLWLRCKAPATGARSLCCAAGAGAMQPRSRRQLEAQNLAKLGMKAKLQQRMGAKIGLSESCCPREQFIRLT